MKFKRFVAGLLAVVMMVLMLPVMMPTVQAAYDYLFPVNNGGNIAYVYGYSDAYGAWHDGIDIHSYGDDTIYAACGGTVTAVADSCWHVSCGYACEHYTTYGNYVRVMQDDGTTAYYGHLLRGSLMVSTGMRVERGQALALMGSSGYSTGKHLHFEVRSGSEKINVNPVSGGGSINYSYYGYGPVDPIVYTTMPEDTFYIKNNANGEYMVVSYSEDVNTQNVHTWPLDANNNGFQIDFTAASSGYKLRPLCSASRLINSYGSTVQSGNNVNIYDDWNESSQWWGFEAVDGGFVIRNMMNQSCVLTSEEGRNIFVSSYTGSD